MADFIEATRYKYRFPSDRGELNVEQLWDLPLTSRNGFNLNAVAIAVNTELKGLSEDSFVETNDNPRRNLLSNMLDVVKYVISVKQSEAKAATEKAAKDSLKKQLQEVIAVKRNEQLASTSIEELEAQLAALSS